MSAEQSRGQEHCLVSVGDLVVYCSWTGSPRWGRVREARPTMEGGFAVIDWELANMPGHSYETPAEELVVLTSKTGEEAVRHYLPQLRRAQCREPEIGHQMADLIVLEICRSLSIYLPDLGGELLEVLREYDQMEKWYS